jgi:glycosyltransferase involved in cell wall biosynthesis
MDARTPRVSVVMNFLDEQRFIESAIASVHGQSHDSWELLLVDDGSTDASTGIAKRHAARDPARVRYLEHADHANRGASAARNLGLAAATGELVAFLDADDVWLPNRLERATALFHTHPAADMVYGRTEYWYSWAGDRRGPPDWIQPHGFRANRTVAAPDLLVMYLEAEASLPCMGSLTVRREAALACGGFVDEFRGLYDDQAFLARFCLDHDVFVSEECWDRYRQHADSMCAVAERSDSAVAARQAYFSWLASWLEQRGLRGTRVWDALGRARAEIHDRRWHARFARALRRASRRIVTAVRSADAPAQEPGHD